MREPEYCRIFKEEDLESTLYEIFKKRDDINFNSLEYSTVLTGSVQTNNEL